MIKLAEEYGIRIDGIEQKIRKQRKEKFYWENPEPYIPPIRSRNDFAVQFLAVDHSQIFHLKGFEKLVQWFSR